MCSRDTELLEGRSSSSLNRSLSLRGVARLAHSRGSTDPMKAHGDSRDITDGIRPAGPRTARHRGLAMRSSGPDRSRHPTLVADTPAAPSCDRLALTWDEVLPSPTPGYFRRSGSTSTRTHGTRDRSRRQVGARQVPLRIGAAIRGVVEKEGPPCSTSIRGPETGLARRARSRISSRHIRCARGRAPVAAGQQALGLRRPREQRRVNAYSMRWMTEEDGLRVPVDSKAA